MVFVKSDASDPGVAAATVKAVLDEFTINFVAQLKAKTSQATGYYQAQVGVARDALNDANNALQAYIRDHPNVRTITANTSNPTPADPNYLKLSVNLDSARDTYGRVLNDFGQSQVIANTADGGTAYFHVVDQPELPTVPLHVSKKAMLIRVVAGGILGVFGFATVLALLWKTDTQVRVTQDVQHFGVEVIELPSLKLKSRRRWPREYLRMAGALQAGFGSLRNRS